jgi:uncharacterized protein YqgV (UPF0045/DUF77 family)
MDEKDKNTSQFIDDWEKIIEECDLPENSVERYEYIQTKLEELMDAIKVSHDRRAS